MTIPRTLLLAEDIGRVVRQTRAAHGDVVAAVQERIGGFRLFQGKIVDIARRTDAGFTKAEARLEGSGQSAGSMLVLDVQNEHLVARIDGEIAASVPDLIIMLDSESGKPITTEEMRYGFRVTVIAAPCDPRWRSAEGLEVVGPRYFGYDIDFVPIEQRRANRL
jgi:DUF917 family protein